MQKLLLPIVWLLFCCHVSQSQLRLPSNEGKKPAQLKLAIEDGDAATGLPFSKTTLKLPITNLKGQPSTFETTDFKLKDPNPETDPYGLQHYHYTQTINGIEVDGAEMRVHVKNGTVESQTGNWLLDVPARLQQLRANQSTDAILQTVEGSLKGQKLASHDLSTSSTNGRTDATIPDDAKLVYVPIGRDLESLNPDSVRLAYRFTVKTSGFGRYMYYIDATNGELLYKINLVCRIMGAKNHVHTSACGATATTTPEPLAPTLAPPPTVTESIDVNSTLWTRYSGSQKTFTTKRSDGKWSLKDLSRNIDVIFLDSLNDAQTKVFSKPYLNNSNQWRLKSDKDFDGFAYDVLWGSQVTYDYFKNNLGKWLYTSGKFGQKLTVYANTDFLKLDPYAPNSVNAFYSGEEVVIGMGDPKNGINPLSTLDVMAHEIVHGITASTSGLRYINESGAVNEALSDIFGTAVERYKRPQRWNYTMGEDIGLIIRSMSNPRAYGQPSEYGGQYFLNYLANFDLDNGGVHINSGIMNRWFYLLCEGGKGTNEAGKAYDVKAIGMNDAIKIVWLAQQQYITAGMNFYNVSNATFRAVRAIFGEKSNQTRQLQNAWYAVNVSKEVITNVCPDNNEPNNDFKTATPLTIGKPISGSMGDFVKSGYNADLGTDSKEVEIPNDKQYADWFMIKTTDSHPNLSLSLKTYFSDLMTVTLYEYKWGALERLEERSTDARAYYEDFIIPLDATTLEVQTPIFYNEVKGRTYYIEVIHGYGSGNASLDFLSSTSNGCYELTTYTSPTPYPRQAAPEEMSWIYSATKKALNNKMVYWMNINSEIPKNYKFLSLPNDTRANNAPVQRTYDNNADQIWHMIHVNENVYRFRNLDTDKVIEWSPKTNKLFMGNITSTDKQDFAIYTQSAQYAFSPDTDRTRLMSVRDTLTSSQVVIDNFYCEDNSCLGQIWRGFNAKLADPGEYIIRSLRDKRALTLVNAKILNVKAFAEEPTQKWNLTYDKDGRYVVTSTATGKAINLTAGNTAENATYDLTTPNPKQETQRWKVLPTGRDGSVKLANSSTNKTLSAKENGGISQYAYKKSVYQRWYLDKVQKLKEGYYFVQNRATGLYMDVASSRKEDGSLLASYMYTGDYNQLFYLQPQTDGTYIIEAVHSNGKALATKDNNNGSQLYQWTTDAKKTNYRWRVEYVADGYFKVLSVFNGKAVQAGKSASASGKNSPIVQDSYALNNYYQHWKFNILGTPLDKTIQTLTEVASVGSAETLGDQLMLYPNPAQNRVTVAYDLAKGETATIKLLNLTGTGLMSQPAEPRQTVLDVSQVDTGLYFISLETNTGKRKTQKLVIQK